VVLELGCSAARFCLLGLLGRNGKRRRVEPASGAAFVRSAHGLERDDGWGLARRDRTRERPTALQSSWQCWFAAALPFSSEKSDLDNGKAFSSERRTPFPREYQPACACRTCIGEREAALVCCNDQLYRSLEER